jgi:uncharacterized protein (TIGR00255 family)
MLLSMTGFGEASYQSDDLSIGIELRAVNNRYLKVSLRTVEPYHLLEPEFERVIRKSIKRGTVQVALRCQRRAAPTDFQLNRVALRSYLGQLRSTMTEMNLPVQEDRLVAAALALPGVAPEPGIASLNLEEDWHKFEGALNQAVERLQTMRRDEGKAMADELLGYRDAIAAHLKKIQGRAPHVAETYRDRLFERVRSLVEQQDVKLDRSDLIKEVSVFAERSDIAEEIVRLASHLDQFHDFLNESESTGRKLEFLTQEMFREANTIGSKASDVEISRHVVEIKGTLEKIRELVQNVE